MRFSNLLFALSLAACTPGGPVDVGGVRVDANLRALADEQHFDYTGHLSKTLKNDTTSLAQLLSFDAGQDSLVATGHGHVLRAVLEKLGDSHFSKNLAALPEDVRRRVWAALEQAGAASLQTTAPLTFKVVMPATEPTEHRGLYVFDPKNSTFRDCAEPDAKYVTIDETDGDLEKNYRRLLKFPYPYQPVFAEVKGFKTPYFGNRDLSGDFAGFFIVTEILDLEVKNYRNTCIPYDLWAMGTEPFWYAQVSEAEGVIEFRGMDDERTKVFSYQPPIQDDSLKIYTGVNQDSGDNIRIEVSENGPCSDGMSDIKYRLSVRMTMNGKEYNGCGIPFEAAAETGEEAGGN
ncbi:MAG: hypothetical protein HY842_02950 [Bacteroidetes bacterium]|nr:hypothetical protein [Bacteroidota bacterium]